MVSGISQSLKGLAFVLAGSNPRHGKYIFLFFHASRPTLEPTNRLLNCVQGYLPLWLMRQERAAGHSPPPNAEV